MKVLESDFRGDFDHNKLESELHLIPAVFKQSTPVNFRKQDVSRHGWRKTSNDKEYSDHHTNCADMWCDISRTRTLIYNVGENQNLP